MILLLSLFKLLCTCFWQTWLHQKPLIPSNPRSYPLSICLWMTGNGQTLATITTLQLQKLSYQTLIVKCWNLTRTTYTSSAHHLLHHSWLEGCQSMSMTRMVSLTTTTHRTLVSGFKGIPRNMTGIAGGWLCNPPGRKMACRSSYTWSHFNWMRIQHIIWLP